MVEKEGEKGEKGRNPSFLSEKKEGKRGFLFFS